MPRTALAADADRFDPWGFGTTAADEPTVVLDVTGLVDDDVSGLAAFDRRADAANDADAAVAELVARVARPSASGGPGAWRVSGPVAAILAVFLLVILGQAFYIAFSLSGAVQASAAPPVELVVKSRPAATPVLREVPPIREVSPAREDPAMREELVTRPAPPARVAVPTGPAAGWLRVQSPFEVQVFERGQLVGSSATDRILVTAGAHLFELVNTSLGYRTTMKTVVGTGRTEALAVEAPRSAVQVNALPWAEVLVDGRVLGETPLANLQLPIGVHQLVFRHPDLGERAQTVTVRLDGPNRVTADLRR